MNNLEASIALKSCLEEFDAISKLIEGLGHTSKPIPYLTKYALIKACGTIEFCFKTIIADIHRNQTKQIKNFIDKNIRMSSMNPSKSNICKTLSLFDDAWNREFKEKLKEHSNVKRIEDSLDSLNNSRNTFAHGGSITLTFDTIKTYLIDAIEVVKILDSVVMLDVGKTMSPEQSFDGPDKIRAASLDGGGNLDFSDFHI